MPTFIGTAPNQIPINGYLGPLAYRNENPSGAIVGANATQTLTGKTIAFANNTLTDVVGVNATQTLTNKTLDGGTY